MQHPKYDAKRRKDRVQAELDGDWVLQSVFLLIHVAGFGDRVGV